MTNSGAGRQDGGVLVRIIMLLLSAAAFADRAATYPAPVRCAVLWVLRRVEIVTRLFIIGLAADCGFRAEFAAPIVSRGCGSPADAAALAEAFEILAQVLDELLPYALVVLEHTGQGAGLCWFAPAAGLLLQRWHQQGGFAKLFPDTS